MFYGILTVVILSPLLALFYFAESQTYRVPQPFSEYSGPHTRLVPTVPCLRPNYLNKARLKKIHPLLQPFPLPARCDVDGVPPVAARELPWCCPGLRPSILHPLRYWTRWNGLWGHSWNSRDPSPRALYTIGVRVLPVQTRYASWIEFQRLTLEAFTLALSFRLVCFVVVRRSILLLLYYRYNCRFTLYSVQHTSVELQPTVVLSDASWAIGRGKSRRGEWDRGACSIRSASGCRGQLE